MGIRKLREADLQALLDNLWDGIYIVDANRKITHWSKGAEEITGYAARETVGRECGRHLLAHHTDNDLLCEMGCPLDATLQDGERREARFFLRHKNGFSVPIFVRLLPYHDKDGKIAGAVEIFRRVDGGKETADLLSAMERDAQTDRLTGASRREFGERVLEGALTAAERRSLRFGIMLLDFDRFKPINDTYGHAAGDLVLREAVADIRRHLRSTDLLVRWGGDEFLVIAPHLDLDGLRFCAEKIRRVIQEACYLYNGIPLSLTISGGIVLPEPGDTMQSLLERADARLYKAKQSGKNRIIYE